MYKEISYQSRKLHDTIVMMQKREARGTIYHSVPRLSVSFKAFIVTFPWPGITKRKEEKG